MLIVNFAIIEIQDICYKDLVIQHYSDASCDIFDGLVSVILRFILVVALLTRWNEIFTNVFWKSWISGNYISML